MADHRSIAAAANSIVRLLEQRFGQIAPLTGGPTRVGAVRTNDLGPEGDSPPALPALTLFLYRIDFNKSLRAAWSAVGHQQGDAHLPLDLHFLLTAWANNAEDEYRILGRAMQSLEDTPILTGALLEPSTNWTVGEAVQVCLEDLSTEDVMRIFDSLPVDYRLSIPYAARVVVLDGAEQHTDPLVTTTASGLRPGVTP